MRLRNDDRPAKDSNKEFPAFVSCIFIYFILILLIPEASFRIRVTVNDELHSPVPEDAIIPYERKNYIFTTDDNCLFVLTPVTTGPSLNGCME